MTINVAIFLASLSMVESNDNDRAVGALGEISRFQMKPAVWKRFSHQACGPECPTCAIKTASDYLRYLADNRDVPEIAKTVTGFASLWNYGLGHCGLRNFEFSRYPKSVRARAERVQNLYDDLIRTMPVQTKPKKHKGKHEHRNK